MKLTDPFPDLSAGQDKPYLAAASIFTSYRQLEQGQAQKVGINAGLLQILEHDVAVLSPDDEDNSGSNDFHFVLTRLLAIHRHIADTNVDPSLYGRITVLGEQLARLQTRWFTFSKGHGPENRIDSAFVDTVNQATYHLRLMDDSVGGYALLQVATSQAKYVNFTLNNCRYDPQTERRLYRAMADLLRLQAWMWFDIGHHVAAQNVWVMALHAAHSAGDDGLAAHILGYMSDQAKEILPGHAVTLAEAALDTYRGDDTKVAAILFLRSAQAYSAQADLVRTRRAIDAAFESYARTSVDHEGPDWAYWINAAQLHGRAAGGSYLRLGKWEPAAKHLQSALELQDESFIRENALWYIQLAMAKLGLGELEEACMTASHAIELLNARVASAQCAMYLRRFVAQLTPYKDVAAVQSFIEHVRQVEEPYAKDRA